MLFTAIPSGEFLMGSQSGENSHEEPQHRVRITDRFFLLPTEAEWEYACRAGTTTRHAFGDDDSLLAGYGVYNVNSDSKTAPCGSRIPNAWGLFDMHGNVCEWCQDWYDEGYYGNSPTDDPQGPASGSTRVIRSGSWFGSSWGCRSAFLAWSRTRFA
jgi:formylglycine-generating enzyme required for sulfatase activity